MRRPSELSLSRLESREVPAASLFAEIRPGVWGSNPILHGASGDTLYFTANNIVNGNELWATDGTRTGTRMVADLNPGKPGSGIYGIPAGGGTMYFIQQNEFGTQRRDFKTDGTAAGTVPISNGINSILTAGGMVLAGMNGELVYLAKTATPGVWALSKTDGTTTTVLSTFNDQPLAAEHTGSQFPAFPYRHRHDGMADGKYVLSVMTQAGQVQVWQTDGTVVGTVLQQSNLSATSPTTGTVELVPGAAIGGNQFLFRSVTPYNPTVGSLWAGDGTTTRQLVRSFDGVFYEGFSAVYQDSYSVSGGRMIFNVIPKTAGGPTTADTGIWVSDGTAAGTTRLNLPTFGTHFPVVRGTFDGKAVVQVPTADPNKWNWVLTDGTTTTPVPTPPGTQGLSWGLAAVVPPEAGSPKGHMLFQVSGGPVYRTDGTAAGTATIDTTGLTISPNSMPVNWISGGQYVSLGSGMYSGTYFKGDVYFPGRPAAADPRLGRELWKWDLAATTTPAPAPAPKVVRSVVNDGSAQRSMVKSLTVTFDSLVNVSPAGVSITNARGVTPAFTQQLATVNGVTVLTITFPTGVGGSIADGRWTLWIDNTAVRRQGGGTAMAADHSFTFTRLYGDLTGDGIYDRSTRLAVQGLLGKQAGDPGFNAAYDVNSDGKIDATDELAAVRNWGKAV